MNEHDHKQLEDFLAAIEPNLVGYKHATFNFIAFKNDGVFELRQARLNLQGVPATHIIGHFESKNIKAGVFRLDDLKLSVPNFIENLLTGSLRTPYGDLHFPPEAGQSHSAYFTPYHNDGILTQRRQMQLNLRGGRRHFTISPSLDWELKAAQNPFFNLQELLDEYLIGQIKGDFLNVEIVAFNVAAISAESSIDGEKAYLSIDLAEGLQKEKTSIGFRVFDKNKVVKRGLLSGVTLNWSNVDGVQRGKGEIEIPTGAIVDCIANYAEVAQTHRWVFDPKTTQNQYRSVHHAFDPNLDVLQKLIKAAQNKGANARDLEVAVAWLLWMLGFSTTHIGGTAKTSDAPDLIASTPQGHFLVIECTTGILKEDNKLPHVVERSEKVRQSLAASGHQHLKVLPVIITTKTREEIRAEIDQAHQLGVLVATQETFGEVFNRTLQFPDANRFYVELEQSLNRDKNKQLAGNEGFA